MGMRTLSFLKRRFGGSLFHVENKILFYDTFYFFIMKWETRSDASFGVSGSPSSRTPPGLNQGVENHCQSDSCHGDNEERGRPQGRHFEVDENPMVPRRRVSDRPPGKVDG